MVELVLCGCGLLGTQDGILVPQRNAGLLLGGRPAGRSVGRVAVLRSGRALVALGIAILCGCSATAQVPVDESDPVFDELIQTALAGQRPGGAGPAQLDVLRAARAAGEVTLEQAREAARATVACFEEAGLRGSFVETTEPSGLIVPGFTGGSTSDDMTPIDQCDNENGHWVSMVYQLQPASEQIRTDFYEANAHELRACLEAEGFETDPDATGAELARQAGDVAAETAGVVDCLTVVGL